MVQFGPKQLTVDPSRRSGSGGLNEEANGREGDVDMANSRIHVGNISADDYRFGYRYSDRACTELHGTIVYVQCQIGGV